MRFDDFIMRAIEQLVAALARILRLSKAGNTDEAKAELAQAYDQLLGNDRVFLDMVDSGTLANLLGSPDKVRVLAALSELEARVCEQTGDRARAERLRGRASELSAIAREDDPKNGARNLIDELEE